MPEPRLVSDLPSRIAICSHPDGEHLHIPLRDDEPFPTTCFMHCDCTPVEYVRADHQRGAVTCDRCEIELTVLRAEVARLQRQVECEHPAWDHESEECVKCGAPPPPGGAVSRGLDEERQG